MITDKKISLKSHSQSKGYKSLPKKNLLDKLTLEKKAHQEKDTLNLQAEIVKNKILFTKNNSWISNFNNKSNKILTNKKPHWKKLQIVEVEAIF